MCLSAFNLPCVELLSRERTGDFILAFLILHV